MGLIGDIFSGISGSNAAKSAANAQQQGAEQAQQLIGKDQQAALDYIKQNFGQFISTGQDASKLLDQFIQNPFEAPTLEQAQQNPGYQFALAQGSSALDKSAAARGNVLSGGAGVAQQQYGQQLGEQNYQQVYNNAMQQYMNRFNVLSGTSEQGIQAATPASADYANTELTGAGMQSQQINNAAAARASGYVGSANAWNSSINNFNNQAMEAAMLAGV